MKHSLTKLSLTIIAGLILTFSYAQQVVSAQIDFCGTPLSFDLPNKPFPCNSDLSQQAIVSFYNESLDHHYDDVIRSLKDYRKKYKPDDWLYYQLIRKTAQYISPKENDYHQYTLFKWFFLTRTGYDAILRVSADKILFYIQCDENIYNIPNHLKNNKQYVCLNYHDYKNIDFNRESFADADIPASAVERTFSYKVTRVPDFKATEYLEKDIHFSYYENDYHFKVKLTPHIQKLFTNYPVVDYESYLNIPLSRETYNSLIPQLKKNIKGLNVKSGVDYLMRFTRYAFLFETDTRHFGTEKRLSPEQTLTFDQSDCEDRVALFFYLVKEIYALPMIVLSFPTHVSIAVQFDKPIGNYITYQGKKYSVCEPTPQKQDLLLGQMLPELRNTSYEVAYSYQP